MKKIIVLIVSLAFFSIPSKADALCNFSQTLTSENKNIPAWSDVCTVSGVDGIDNGAQVDSPNTASLTITNGGAVTINANSKLVVGSISVTDGNISIQQTGQILVGQPLFITDNDNDGAGDYFTTMSTQSTSSAYKRLSLLSTFQEPDCNPADNTIWRGLTGYLDQDGDTYGSGSLTSVCSGSNLPSGYASNSTDCKDTGTDASQVYVSATCYQDLDGDTYTTSTAQSTCANSTTCSSITKYVDGNGTVQTSASSLASSASASSDCDDTASAKYTNRTCYYDGDNDGYRTTSSQTRCVGANCTNSSDSYKRDSTAPEDCDDTNATKYILKNVCTSCNCTCKQTLSGGTCSGCSTATYTCVSYCYDVQGTNCYCRYCPNTTCKTCCSLQCTN